MSKTRSIVLVVVLSLTAGIAHADVVYGEATNLGTPVNSEFPDASPGISADGLELYFVSLRPGGHGEADLYVATRPTTGTAWDTPVNLGPTINSPAWDAEPSIPADGLLLLFDSTRPGGLGDTDIYFSTRPTSEDAWSEPFNVGEPVNSSSYDGETYISADGLELYFVSDRDGGYGESDIYVSRRLVSDEPWGPAENLGPIVNTTGWEGAPYLSSDGRRLFMYGFSREGFIGPVDIWMASRPSKNDDWADCVRLGSEINSPALDTNPCLARDDSVFYIQSLRPDGLGEFDLWQVSVNPLVDFNGDDKVDLMDLEMLIDNWATDDPLYDIGPTPWGDGVVDVEDLMVFITHWENEKLASE